MSRRVNLRSNTESPGVRSAVHDSFAFLLLSIALVSLSVLSACGASQGRASVKPAAMPPGGTFSGVWFSSQYGEMQVVQSGNQVVATYEQNERKGRIQGTAVGNLLRFQWKESRELVPGRPTETEGRGYFQYTIGEDGKHYIVGEWGHETSEVDGGPWRAYKLRHKKARVGGTDSGMDASSAVDAVTSDGGDSENEDASNDSSDGSEEGSDIQGLDGIQ